MFHDVYTYLTKVNLDDDGVPKVPLSINFVMISVLVDFTIHVYRGSPTAAFLFSIKFWTQ